MAGRRKAAGGDVVVMVRVESVEAIFNPFDPTSIPGRELDPDVAAYISERLGGGRGRQKAVARLVVCLDEPLAGERAEPLRGALREAFGQEEERTRRRLRALMAEGRRSLVVSVSFVVLVMLLVLAVWGPPDDVPLLIGGWVSILSWVVLWRPIEIFFYDWWPIVAERRMWRELGHAGIEFRAIAPAR